MTDNEEVIAVLDKYSDRLMDRLKVAVIFIESESQIGKIHHGDSFDWNPTPTTFDAESNDSINVPIFIEKVAVRETGTETGTETI